MKFEIQTACPYCGQMMFVNTYKAEITPEELSELAAEKCDCDEAVVVQGMKATEDAIVGVLAEGASDWFGQEIPQQVIDVVRNICMEILRRRINTVTLTVPGGDVLKLVRNGNAVKIRRTCKKQLEM